MSIEDVDPALGTVLAICGESLLIPAMVEALVAEGQIDRETADCTTDWLVSFLDETLAADGDPADVAAAATVAVAFGIMGALIECGVSLDDLADINQEVG
ncbi:MAG: hypothetical protein F4Z31_02315 [Gemmatimonadetes bacterium]|nr:hypothetical protein [Gemmatimonadota bacterium]